MTFLIKRRITICMLFLALTALGYISYRQLPLELLPNAEYPTMNIQVSTTNEVDPNYLETQAVQQLEGTIRSVEGIESVRTNIHPRGASIQVEFKKSVNFKFASVKLQEKIKERAATLPSSFRVSSQKGRGNQGMTGFITLQILGEGGTDRVRHLTDQYIKQELENIDGISSVNVYGGREKSIEIRLNPDVCKAHNLTPSKITALLNDNKGDRTFTGKTTHFGREYFVYTEALYESVADLEQIVVAPGPLLLKDVATVSYDLKEETSRNRMNGKDAVSVVLMNDSQKNIIELSKEVEQNINRLNDKMQLYGIEIVEQSNTARVMDDNLKQIAWLALIGGLLAVIVLWLFLRNLRLVLIISLAIPISVLTAFNLFYSFGITINSLTLVGMALAIGMLLDNGIVVLENIYRLRGRGLSPEDSVMKGTGEVGRSILAATLTTITVFLPFIFTDNYLIRLIGYQIGVSIISTLGISLLVAFLFIPMATYGILRSGDKKRGFYRKISLNQRPVQIYLVLLKMSMRNAFAVFAGAIVVLFVVVILVTTNKKSNLRAAESDRFNVNIRMNQGATLESTDEFVKVMEEQLADMPEKKDLIATISENNATITVVLKPNYEKIGKRNMQKIREDVMRNTYRLQNVSVWTSDAASGGDDASRAVTNMLGRMMQMMGIGNRNEEIRVKGLDYNTMQLVSEDFNYYLKQKEFIGWTYCNSTGNRPEIHLTPDPLLLNSYSISRQQISSALNTLNGETPSGVRFKVDNEELEILIRTETPPVIDTLALNEPQPKGMSDLHQLSVVSGTGGIHSLGEISAIRKSHGSPTINRLNGAKEMGIYFNFTSSEDAPEDLIEGYREEIASMIANYNLPPGVALEYVKATDEFADFRFLLFAAALLIFMILASVFESLITPFVLLFTIPLAAIGALLGIYLTNNSLMNSNTLIGMLILLGVVVNNGIILIDYANILRRRGYRREMALMQAGLSRLRPILITSITTIVALLPMALGKSEYSGLIGAPFAITVIGGLACSSLLTLILIPTAYMGLENTLAWYRTLSKKVKLAHLCIWLVAIWLVYNRVNGMLYQTLCLVALTILIPGVTYFIQRSLRNASTTLIEPEEPVSIRIQNLVKVYERPNRFKREWQSGQLRNERIASQPSRWDKIKDKTEWVIIPALLAWLLGNTLGWWIGLGIVSFLLYQIRRYSKKIAALGIKPADLKGRLRLFKRVWYWIATHTPIIGRQKKPFKALRGVSMTIHTGMFGLLGPNGAGKSTMIRTISGILDQSYGSIWINSFDTREYREELQGLIGYLPQEFGTYEHLSAWEFLDYQAILKGLTNKEIRHERLRYVLDSVHMTERKDELIGSFSGGMKQRIGIALILLHLPRILVVDEPTAGLDPRERIRFRNLLVELSKERIVIFSTHIIEDISSSCNQVAVINKGEMKYHGTPNEMLRFAEGLVWTFRVTPEQFDTELDPQYVVLHIQEEDMILVRYIAPEPPYPDARPAEPNLEDAYLCLLKNLSVLQPQQL